MNFDRQQGDHSLSRFLQDWARKQTGLTMRNILRWGVLGVLSACGFATSAIANEAASCEVLNGRETSKAFVVEMLERSGGDAEQRFAFVVGVSQYRDDAVPDLGNAVGDAQLMAAVFEALGFRVVVSLNQTEREALQCLRKNRERSKQDLALFYFAGHGVQDGGANFGLMADAKVTGGALSGALAFNDVIDGLSADAAAAFLDACRNNPFPDVFKNGLAEVNEDELSASRAVPLLISYATQPGLVASDGGGENSPYASALATFLPKPGLSLAEALTEATLTVQRGSFGAQTPMVVSGLTEQVHLNGVYSQDDVGVRAAVIAEESRTLISEGRRLDAIAKAAEAATPALESGASTAPARGALVDALRYVGGRVPAPNAQRPSVGAAIVDPVNRRMAYLGRSGIDQMLKQNQSVGPLTLWDLDQGVLLASLWDAKEVKSYGAIVGAAGAYDYSSMDFSDPEAMMRKSQEIQAGLQNTREMAAAAQALAPVFSPDGRRLALHSLGDDVVRVWDLADPAAPKSIDVPTGFVASEVHFDATGARMLVSGPPGVAVWEIDFKAPKTAPLAQWRPQTDDWGAIGLSGDGETAWFYKSVKIDTSYTPPPVSSPSASVDTQASAQQMIDALMAQRAGGEGDVASVMADALSGQFQDLQSGFAAQMSDIQKQAKSHTQSILETGGATVTVFRLDVASGAEVELFADIGVAQLELNASADTILSWDAIGGRAGSDVRVFDAVTGDNLFSDAFDTSVFHAMLSPHEPVIAVYLENNELRHLRFDGSKLEEGSYYPYSEDMAVVDAEGTKLGSAMAPHYLVGWGAPWSDDRDPVKEAEDELGAARWAEVQAARLRYFGEVTVAR